MCPIYPNPLLPHRSSPHVTPLLRLESRPITPGRFPDSLRALITPGPIGPFPC